MLITDQMHIYSISKTKYKQLKFIIIVLLLSCTEYLKIEQDSILLSS